MSNNMPKKKIVFSYNAPVVLTFALLSLIVFGISVITGGKSTTLLFSVYRSKFSFWAILRMFLHVMGHGSMAHYTGNMMLFLLLGPVLEEKYGSKRLLLMMAIVAFVS